MKEESESDSELNVDEDDEEDDIADRDDEEVSPESSPRPLIPTPLLAGARPPFPGFVGLQDLIRPSFPHGPGVTPGAPLPSFPGMPNSLFDKGKVGSLITKDDRLIPHLDRQPYKGNILRSK